MAADFRGDARNILLLMVFAKIPHRVSFAASGGWYLLTSIADYKESLHEAEYHTIIAETLGAKVEQNALPEIFITDKDRIFINNFLNKYGIKRRHACCYTPWRQTSGKTVARITIYRSWALFNRRVWGKDYSYGLTRGITAYEEDKNLNKRSSGIGATEINSFKQLTALFERCTLYIGVSSGPSHMAGVARLPSVLIFWPESVSQWHPLGNQYYIAKKRLSMLPV